MISHDNYVKLDSKDCSEMFDLDLNEFCLSAGLKLGKVISSRECLQDTLLGRAFLYSVRTPEFSDQELEEISEGIKLVDSIDFEDARKRIQFIDQDPPYYYIDDFNEHCNYALV